MTETEIDRAHQAMMADVTDDGARMRFYERLADTELFLLLGEEPDDQAVTPETFQIEDAQYALVFDREERLADFTGRAVPYAALSGRALVGMIAGQQIGLALNPGQASSAILIPSAAIDWLSTVLGEAPEEREARIAEIAKPAGLPQNVVTGLDRKLAIAGGMARMAYLAAARYDDGGRGHVLAFVDAPVGAESALANAAGEALRFSGIEAGTIDVMFIRATDPVAARFAKVGLRFDLPQPEERPAKPPPGSDPEKPPRLR